MQIYQQRQKEAEEKGWLVLLGEESLIFDEVKVTVKLQWNNQDNSLVGYAITSDEMASMTDVYRSIEQRCFEQTTSCRPCGETTSNSDIIGPYYTSSGSMTANFTVSCLMDAMRSPMFMDSRFVTITNYS